MITLHGGVPHSRWAIKFEAHLYALLLSRAFYHCLTASAVMANIILDPKELRNTQLADVWTLERHVDV